MVSNKEAKILNPSGYHKVYSPIFEMCMYIVKQDMHVANQDNGNQVLSEDFLKSIGFSKSIEIVRAHPRACCANWSGKGKMITKLTEGKTIILYNIT